MKSQPGKRQVVLITGAAGGIGRCCAREFAHSSRRFELVLTDLNNAALTATANDLRNAGGRVHTRVVDVTDRSQVEALARWVIDDLGGLDILINNAGIGYMGELADTSMETWRRLIAVNLLGPLHHIYAFLPHMMARGSGHITNVSSGQAFFQLPTWGAYAAIKLALGMVSETLHFELKRHGIKVTTVYPFLVNTGFYDTVEPTTLSQQLSMRLMPYYSMRPEVVGRIIYQAVIDQKRVEMVTTINRLGKVSNAIPPIANGVRRVAGWLLGKRPQRAWPTAPAEPIVFPAANQTKSSA